MTDDASHADATDSQAAPAWVAVSRGAALFLGAFALLNLLGEIRSPQYDATLWWLDLPPWCPPTARRSVVGLAGVLLVLFALRPSLPRPVRGLAVLTVVALTAVALVNAVEFFRSVHAGALRSTARVPFSLHVAACLLVILAGLARAPVGATRLRDAIVALLTLAACVAGFPLAQMSCCGRTDGRRAADAAVVFGDGATEDALRARLETGCELYREGLTPRLILCGDAAALRETAVAGGVPAGRIAIHDGGETLWAVADLCRSLGVRRALAVNDFHRLPRIKVAGTRAGLDVDTVPAGAGNELPAPREIAHEVAALWAEYLRPVMIRR